MRREQGKRRDRGGGGGHVHSSVVLSLSVVLETSCCVSVACSLCVALRSLRGRFLVVKELLSNPLLSFWFCNWSVRARRAIAIG